MCPVHRLRLEAHQNVEKQGCPKLPADGVFTVAEEVTDLQGLFDLLEEYFDAPPGLIEFTDRAGSPLRVVCCW